MLATSWEAMDAKSVEFVLRDDVLFHDGETSTPRQLRRTSTIQTAEGSTARVARYATDVQGEVVDEFTVDLVLPRSLPDS